MTFFIDSRITTSCIELCDWPLSRVFLKNNACYPWLILVPRCTNIQEINELPRVSQHQLIDEISHLSCIVKELFQPDKLNVGALGNIVSQLHVHVIARFKQDALWPHGIWQDNLETTPYPPATLQELSILLQTALNTISVFNK